MRKQLFTFVSSMLLLAGSSVYADCGCREEFTFKGGSFVANRTNTAANLFPPPTAFGILDQYMFNADGTGFWQQSSTFFFPLTQGVESSEIGTWKVKDGHVYLTTVGFGGIGDPVGTDLTLSNNTRATQKFKIINKNTLEIVHRVVRSIDTNDPDPLTAEGTVTLDSRERFKAHRVRVRISDLK